MRLRAVVLACATANPLPIGLAAPPPDVPEAKRPVVQTDDSWNALFDRQEGWTGGDVAGSVDLGDGRILWLFGDTWIGSIRSGKRMPGARMVNNSIAVHETNKTSPGQPPDPRCVHFYWGVRTAAGQPTAWIVPTGTTGGAATPGDHDWLWPTGGGLSIESASHRRRLLLFFFRVRRNAQGKGVWQFSVVGTVLGTIDNPEEAPDRWKVKLLDVPHSTISKAADGKKTERETLWGMTACLAPPPKTPRDKSPDIFVYGVRKTGPFNSSLVLARVPAAEFDRFKSWRFYAGQNSWRQSATAAVPIAEGMVSEFSIEPLAESGGAGCRSMFVLIQSEPFFGSRIFVRTASQPQGPWSPRRAVYTVAETQRNRAYFTYAAKGHAAISRVGELSVTYLVNSNHFSDLTTDTRIYRPQFVRVPAALLF